jgi:hypothetical protein
LSREDRLLQLERLERWCCQASRWQQFRVIMSIGLSLGILAGLVARLAPYPTPDEACRIVTAQTRFPVDYWLISPEACPAEGQNVSFRSDALHSTSAVHSPNPGQPFVSTRTASSAAAPRLEYRPPMKRRAIRRRRESGHTPPAMSPTHQR